MNVKKELKIKTLKLHMASNITKPPCSVYIATVGFHLAVHVYNCKFIDNLCIILLTQADREAGRQTTVKQQSDW